MSQEQFGNFAVSDAIHQLGLNSPKDVMKTVRKHSETNFRDTTANFVTDSIINPIRKNPWLAALVVAGIGTGIGFYVFSQSKGESTNA